MEIITTKGGDFSSRNKDRINRNFAELSDKLLGWEDLRFPAGTLNPPGGVSDADVEGSGVFIGTLLFDAGGTEIAVGQAQLPHAKKLDTDMIAHVHWCPTSTGTGDVLWRLEYVIADIMGVFPTSYTVLDVVDAASGVANKHQIAEFAAIDTTGLGVSAMLCWKLSRIGGDALDTYGSDARLLEFDIHYLVDEVGSAEERSK